MNRVVCGEPIRVEVPGEPKGWQRAGKRVVRNKAGRHVAVSYTQDQTRAEQGAIKWFANVAMQGRAPLEGPLDLRVTAFLPIPSSWSARKQQQAGAGLIWPTGKPDFDNLTKLVCDAVNKLIWRDDAQVVRATVWKLYDVRPRLVFEVRRLFVAAE